MSFIIDPPLLLLLGAGLRFAGTKYAPATEKKVTVSIIIVLLFISVSTMLYLDALPCFFPFICGNLSGSEFMFHSDITGIYKKDVPLLFVIILFALYPLWFYSGYEIFRKISEGKSGR